MDLQFFQHRLRGEDEHTGVPQRSLGQQCGGTGGIGLFDESGDVVHAGRTLDRGADGHVAVAGFRRHRRHAERDDAAGAGACDGVGQDLVQLVHVTDCGVGRHDPEHRLGVGLRYQQCGRSDGGGGVAADRLQHDARIHDAGVAQLLGDQETMFLIANHHGGAEAGAMPAQGGFDDHGPVMVQ